jgi:hypothetical protein
MSSAATLYQRFKILPRKKPTNFGILFIIHNFWFPGSGSRPFLKRDKNVNPSNFLILEKPYFEADLDKHAAAVSLPTKYVCISAYPDTVRFVLRHVIQ